MAKVKSEGKRVGGGMSVMVKTWDESEMIVWLLKNDRKDIVEYIKQLHLTIRNQQDLTNKAIAKLKQLPAHSQPRKACRQRQGKVGGRMNIKEIIEKEKSMDRWQEEIEHHKKSMEIMEFLDKIDFEVYDDSFCWKYGGDGDNGETLMYQLDAFFEAQDNQDLISRQAVVEMLEKESYWPYRPTFVRPGCSLVVKAIDKDEIIEAIKQLPAHGEG
jgi:hypothetical protein